MHILTDVLQCTLNAATHPPVLLVPYAWKIIAILTCHQLCLCLPIPVPCVFILWFFQVYCNMLCIGVTRKWDHETWSHDVDKNFGQVKLGSLPGACEAFWLFDPNIPSSLTDLQQKVVLPGFSFQRFQIKQDMSSANKSSKLSLACF